MAKDIPLGARGEAQETVEFRHTLTAHHPALPPVYSTPNMIRLMERATFLALQPYCEGDEISVGTAINIEHRAASGIGSQIRAEAVLESFDRRFHTLRVTAWNGTLEIGRGTVSRAVVSAGNFEQKLKTMDLAVTSPTALTLQKEKAEAFRAMHHGPRILVLPNAWDAVSARIVEEAGFPTIATSSAGVAFSLGYPDGQKITRTEMLAQVARIVRAVGIPVTADVEAGYGNRPEDAALTAAGVIEAGAIGMNLEDADPEREHALFDLSLQLEKIRAVRELGQKVGIPLVLNARTDVYLAQVGAPETRYDEIVKRLTAFRDAGADSLFAPGIRDTGTIRRLVNDLQHPLNVLAVPGSPSVPELEQLGVRRVSLGSGPMRATLGTLQKLAEELKSSGTYREMEIAPSHAHINQLLK